MSGGTPVGGGYMRQRHSQGYASSGDDLEDDACSRPRPTSPAIPRNRTWIEILENFLWLASAAFIIYYGDRHSNLIYLLWHDDRIRRTPFYLGMAGVGSIVLIFFYSSMSIWNVRRFDEKWELTSLSVLPFITLLGLVSFCLLSFALWPIWSFLSLPLLFTLFMAGMVIFPHVLIGTFRPQYDMFRTD
uniref:Transmembrane protein 128 n=1 Tax=Fagus sylvatica TaxID=28930 RepID=A0A2N9IA29_FAGSY